MPIKTWEFFELSAGDWGIWPEFAQKFPWNVGVHRPKLVKCGAGVVAWQLLIYRVVKLKMNFNFGIRDSGESR